MARDGVDKVRWRGQLMLQISAGRFFRPGVPLYETEHRYTVYSNAWFPGHEPVELPVGRVTASSGIAPVMSSMMAVVDRLERQRPDGTDDFMVATGGTELVDDVAYLMTFVLNRTVSRDHALVHRLVTQETPTNRRSARSLFPSLFDSQQVVQSAEWDELRQFMNQLLGLSRDDFGRAMRAIRTSIDATRRAVEDPTGAYTDLVAALESLADESHSTPTTWDRYDGRKRKILDAVLDGLDPTMAARVRAAVLDADRVGLTRRFVSSTMTRIMPEYFREEANGAASPPRAPDLERMLATAYEVRSRRSHILEDLGEGVWLSGQGAETTYEPNFERVLTLAGLWRLVRHVVRRYVADADQVQPEPWDYRPSLAGIVDMQLAPQYWIRQVGSLSPRTATGRLDGFAEALIGWIAKQHTEGFPLEELCKKIEALVPGLPAGEDRLALIAIHVLWHSWVPPEDHRPKATSFLERYDVVLNEPSPAAYTVAVLSRGRPQPTWSADDWARMASERSEARRRRTHAPLPAAIDALIQLEAADQMEAAGRHDEAVVFASRAVEEMPGNEALLAWECRLSAGQHDSQFPVDVLLFGGLVAPGAEEISTPESRVDAVGDQSGSGAV